MGLVPQDSWRWKHDLTINAGLRYDVQMPFYAQNNSYSTATLDDVFGVTGVGSGFEPGSTVTDLGNLFKPGMLQGTPTTFKHAREEHEGLQHGLEQLRAEHRRGLDDRRG